MELTLTPPGLVAAIARSLLFPRCCASSDAFGQGKSIFRGADGGQYSYQYNVRYNDEFPKLIAEKTVTGKKTESRKLEKIKSKKNKKANNKN